MENVSNQREIWEKARETDDYFVRLEVLKQITDEKLLKEIALSKKEGLVSIEATKRISNQRTLAMIAKRETLDSRIRIEAIRKLKSQKILEEIGLDAARDVSEDACEVCEEVIKLLENEEVVQQIFSVARTNSVRKAAIEKIQAQDFLIAFLSETGREKNMAKFRECRLIAIGKLTDQRALTRIATRSGSPDYERLAAVEKIEKATVLEDVIRKEAEQYIFSSDNSISIAALKKIADQNCLSRIASDERLRSEIRIYALRKLKNSMIISNICFDAKARDVRAAAQERLDELYAKMRK